MRNCVACEHWGRPGDTSDRRVCRKIGYDLEYYGFPLGSEAGTPAAGVIVMGVKEVPYSAFLYTRADFGCELFEPAAEAPA